MFPTQPSKSDNHLSPETLRAIAAGATHDFCDDQDSQQHLDHCATCQQDLEQLQREVNWRQAVSAALDELKPSDRSDYLTDEHGRWGTMDPRAGQTVLDSAYLPDARAWQPVLGNESFEPLADRANNDLFDPAKFILSRLLPCSLGSGLGQLEEFSIQRVIGRGGMGLVFAAYDTQLRRSVAIKFLTPAMEEYPAARQRFLREAEAAASMEHENIIPIYRISHFRGVPFFVMPLMLQGSLQSFVDQRGPLSLEQWIEFGSQMAAGLAAAHKRGLVHRDIKPGNILLDDEQQRVLVADFGLASDFQNQLTATTGIIVGTPSYMSPEQTTGRPVDERSDLFSLGSVLFFAATGQVPFQAENAMMVMDRVRSHPVDLSALERCLPRQLVSIVSELLKKRPQDRPDSAARVRDRLWEFRSQPRQILRPVAGQLPSPGFRLADLNRVAFWGRRRLGHLVRASGFFSQPAGNECEKRPGRARLVRVLAGLLLLLLLLVGIYGTTDWLTRPGVKRPIFESGQLNRNPRVGGDDWQADLKFVDTQPLELRPDSVTPFQ